MEVIDLDNLGKPENISLATVTGGVNKPIPIFDSGVELLMNKKSNDSESKKINISDLDDLEKELNDLSKGISPSMPPPPPSKDNTKTLNGVSNWFNFSKTPEPPIIEVTDSNIGQATKESIGNTKTWDGFQKITEVPPTVPSTNQRHTNLSEQEKRRKKRMMIKRLDDWYEKGLIKNYTRYNIDSPYEDVEDEYETAMEDKRKKDSLKLQSYWLKLAVNSIEFFSTSPLNPFGIDLSGFGEQVDEDIDSYEEIFSELHEKWKGGKLSPEIALLFKLGVTAAIVNFTNKTLSNSVPGVRDVIKQSPELMKIFTNATAEVMGQQNGGFMNNIINTDVTPPNTSYGVPPPPIETKNQPPPIRPAMQFTNRPDLRTREQTPDLRVGGTMFREQGVDIQNIGSHVNDEKPRPEMRGPSSDIDNFLSGLKPKMVNIHDDDSMVSLSSLKDLQHTKLPKQTKKRGKSDKNVISLDI